MLQFLIRVALSVLGFSVVPMIAATLKGKPSLPEATPPNVEQYNLLKHEVVKSQQFSPAGPDAWRFRDRPATLRFDDKRYTVTIQGTNLSGKLFEQTLTINTIVQLREVVEGRK